MRNLHRSTGFTLIELLVVITIIGVLAAVGMASYSEAGKNARDARRKADLNTVRQALVMYRSDTGCYPDESTFVAMVNELKVKKYLSDPVPIDPKNSGTNVYSYTPAGTCTGGSATFILSAPLEKSTPYVLTNP